ncbi:uncharacterized protein LOC110106566 [Dendrobium catenatum]|uniref:uncharacterized protein LOC110106566 n=1 Tax=Dendrobium catenatum TaxID=906689 RepID=UPI0009F2AB1A|nr:uncharacterized protein LOC110106566 [Dendrobium catenatum]
MEEIFTGGPWYVKGHVVGLDKWSPMFSPTSLKGISAPLWIRLPNIPLQCWDDINICRTASKVGKPYLLDGNMFQCGRREYARVCVRVPLNEKLPLGVWVEGLSGKFFQKIIYEGISKLCYECDFIGHTIAECMIFKEKKVTSSVDPDLVRNVQDQLNSREDGSSSQKIDENSYGPWIQVNYELYSIGRSSSFTKSSVDRVQQEEALDITKIAEIESEKAQVFSSKMIVPIMNKFGILSEMEDKIAETSNQELKMGAKGLSKDAYLDTKTVEKSSSGKKVKLLKELKSLGSAMVKHLPCIASDHCPIVLEVFKPVESHYKGIRFEDVWAIYHGAFAYCRKYME